MTGMEKRYVAAYCRVSTEKEDQASSFEGQKRFFREYIERNPAWQLYAIYADEGITGTNVKKREAFKQMMADAREGRFELILTKEISRFARNLLDSISYTRELRRMGVGIFFLNDNLDTRDGDAELRLAILSSIAQEESRRTSERVKWGQKRQMERGVVFGHSLLGYDLKDGKLSINESDAETVRWIFHAYTEEGRGISTIARELAARGIFPKKAEKWSPSVILRILKNEKYCGDLVQKKTFTPDYLSHEKKYNHGQEAFVTIRDHHEPIISRDQFERAQALLSERRGKTASEKFSDTYSFSGKLRCGICGKAMTARVQPRKNGVYHLWRCAGAHDSVSIRNDLVIEAMCLVMGCYENELEDVKNAVKDRLSALFWDGRTERKDENVIPKLLELYLSDDITKEEYLSAKARFLDKRNRLCEIVSSLQNIFDDERWYREVLDRIEVYRDRAEVRLRDSERVFSIDIIRRGRRSGVALSDIQIEKGNDSLPFSSGIDTEENL